MYNLDLLTETVTPKDVANAIGLEVVPKGKNVYCECPSHRKYLGRADGKVSNCVLNDYGYVCFACGAHGSIFDMVMDYCDVSFKEAVKKIAAIAGVSETAEEDGTKLKKSPFSAEELELIGLSSLANPKGDAGKEIIGVSKSRPVAGAFFRRGDEYVLYASAKRITLNQLFQEDEKLYFQIVADNAKIYLDKYNEVYAAFDDRSCETFAKVFDLLSCDNTLDSKFVAEVRNAIFLNMRKIQRIYEEAVKRV